jgi:hypothetical protein
MLTTLLLAAALAGPPAPHVAVMGGIEGSSSYGELPPGYVAEAVTWGADLEGGVRASTLDKYTRAGWYARAWLDGCHGPLCAGLAYSHRDGGAWTKDVTWVRAGLRDPHGLRLTVSYAWDPDRIIESMLSFLAVRKHLALGLEAGPALYQQPGQQWRVGFHARVMGGWGR